VSQIAALIFLAGVGRQLNVVDRVVAARIGAVEADVVEHEELGFRANIDGVAEAGRLDVSLGATAVERGSRV
jgi:hypothetical protein